MHNAPNPIRDLTVKERFTAERFGTVLLLQGHNNLDIPIYCYLSLHGKNLLQFLKDMDEDKHIVPENYGKVLESGCGRPTSFYQEDIMAKYGLLCD